MLEAIANYQFMQNAVVACLLASVVCGMIGVIIVEKNLLMLSGGIAHTAYGGVGLGYLLGFEPMLGAVGFSLAAAFGIGFVKRRGGGGADVLIAIFWSLGMALGIFFIGLAPGYQPDISSYLFGSILSVTRGDLLLMAGLALIITCLVAVFFNDWRAYLFDEEFARILGLKTVFFEYLLLVIVALTVVVLIRMAGIILVIALLSTPAAIAQMISLQLKSRMIWAVALGMLFCFLGLAISYYLNIPSGATIILVSVAAFVLASLLRYFNRKAAAPSPDA